MKKQDMKIEKLYDLTHTMAGEYLSGFEYPWEALEGISAFLTELGNTLPEEEFEKRGENIWIHKESKVAPDCLFKRSSDCVQGSGDPPLRLCPRKRSGRRGRRSGQFHRA